MLTDFLLNTFSTAVDWLVGTRPVWDIPIPDGVTQFVVQCASWDWLFPVHEIFAMFAIVLVGFVSIFGVKWAVKACDWIADVLP